MRTQLPPMDQKLGIRILAYVAGIFILAMGVAFSVNSQLGVSPVSSLPYVMSLITGITMGTTTILVYLLFVLIQILVLRRDFQWISLAQLLFSVLFGYFIDFTRFLLGDFRFPTYAGQLAMLGISIVLISIGVVLYVNANIINMPMEAMTAAVRDKILTRLTFSDVKILLDTTVVVISVLFSLMFLGGVQGVREGTVLSALLIGQVMKRIHRFIVPALHRAIY